MGYPIPAGNHAITLHLVFQGAAEHLEDLTPEQRQERMAEAPCA